MLGIVTAYSSARRRVSLAAAAAIIAVVALADWWTNSPASVGILYLFPILLAGGFLARTQIATLGCVCALLHVGLNNNLAARDVAASAVMIAFAFTGTGLFVSELADRRRQAVRHLEELQQQVSYRRDAEEQLQLLIESSPAAILSIDSSGRILINNDAAQKLLAPGSGPLKGQDIDRYLPDLRIAARNGHARPFRASLQCKGRRNTGEVFQAAAWFSSYSTVSGHKLAAIVADLSEDLRDREQLSLNHLLRNTRILISGISHEMRNVCAAISVVRKNLSSVPELEDHPDFRSLGMLVQALERLASLELVSSAEDDVTTVELAAVLDDLRVLMQPSLADAGITVQCRIPEDLPCVRADRYGLLQVFINLARNSHRALQSGVRKELTISAEANQSTVTVRFRDTGAGVRNPESLFRPFHKATDANGLGLYVSRAIIRSFRGELVHEPAECGCCFAVMLNADDTRNSPAA